MTTLDVESMTFTRNPADPCWGLPQFPEFITEFRDHQWQAFIEITNAYANGADVVLLDAPVGSGKTLIGEMTRRWLARRAMYVCSGKSLQDQFARDFTYAKVLKGRSNYPTADNPHLFQPGDKFAFDHVSAADCDKQSVHVPACSSCPPALEGDDNLSDDEVLHCSECHPVNACHYDRAKAIALASPLAVVNTSYFLAEANNVGKFSKRGFVIVDECDMLEKELMGFFEASISERRMKRYGLPYPKRKTEKAGLRIGDDGMAPWPEWFAEVDTLLASHISRFPYRPSSREQRRELESLQRLRQRLQLVAPRIEEGGWVYDQGRNDKDVVFKPVKVDEFGADVLWAHGDKWLLMSGTIIDPTEMVESLGLPEDKHWELVQVPMTFPVENRPVKYLHTADMSAKKRQESWPKVAAKCQEIAAKHPDERILVHSVSYALTQYLVDNLPRDRTVTYSGASDREHALARYKEIPNGILVGPSLDRGIDLPDDLCRVMVVCKLPFPYLGDKQIAARLYSTRGGQAWYIIQCIRSFVQMTGRAVRHEKDYAVCYILDRAFQDNVWKKGKHLLPGYLKEAIDWSGRL